MGSLNLLFTLTMFIPTDPNTYYICSDAVQHRQTQCLVSTHSKYAVVLQAKTCCSVFITLKEGKQQYPYTKSYILIYISILWRPRLAVFVFKIVLNKQILSNKYLCAGIIQLFNPKVKTCNWAFQLWFKIQSLVLLGTS